MRVISKVVLVLIVLVLLGSPALAETGPAGQPAPADRTQRTVEDLRHRIEDASFKDFNWVALLSVTVAVFLLTIIVWFLQLVIAKVLVFLLPVLAGVFAGLVLPKNPPDSAEMLVMGGAIVIAGTSASLVFMLYASIFDLRQKVKALEER